MATWVTPGPFAQQPFTHLKGLRPFLKLRGTSSGQSSVRKFVDFPLDLSSSLAHKWL